MAMDVERAVAEERGQQDQEDQRQHDREEAALRIAPDGQQVVAQLVRDKASIVHLREIRPNSFR